MCFAKHRFNEVGVLAGRSDSRMIKWDGSNLHLWCGEIKKDGALINYLTNSMRVLYFQTKQLSLDKPLSLTLSRDCSFLPFLIEF